MAEIRIGDGVFHVAIDGRDDAPALLMSNSLGTNLHMWDPQVPALARHFRVIRYDSRGHGKSAAPDRPYAIGELAADALAILDALGVDKAHFVGLSKGGMVGQQLLTYHRERIGRAVLANTSSHMGPADLWNERIRAVREGGMASLVESILARWFTPAFRHRAPDAVARVADMLRTTPAEGYAACCAAIRDMDQREPIRSIRSDVLVIVGAHDPSTTPAVGKTIADAIPGARLASLPTAHLSNIEAPDAFTKIVLDFLTAPARSAAKKATGRKSAGRKTATKKSRTKTPAAKAAGAKKSAAKKTTARKPAARKPATKKAAAKAAPKKPGAKKAAGRAAKKTPRRGRR